jgi:hypothetical protein
MAAISETAETDRRAEDERIVRVCILSKHDLRAGHLLHNYASAVTIEAGVLG